MSSRRPEFFSSGVRHKWHFPVLWASSLPNHPLMSPSQHSVFPQEHSGYPTNYPVYWFPWLPFPAPPPQSSHTPIGISAQKSTSFACLSSQRSDQCLAIQDTFLGRYMNQHHWGGGEPRGLYPEISTSFPVAAARSEPGQPGPDFATQALQG